MHETVCCECGRKIVSELTLPKDVAVVCSYCCLGETIFEHDWINGMYNPSSN